MIDFDASPNLQGSYGPESFSGEEDQDDMYEHILGFVDQCKEVSASLIQKKFRIGYPRAARIIEMLERDGVVGPASGSKPRQVLKHSEHHLD